MVITYPTGSNMRISHILFQDSLMKMLLLSLFIS